MHKSFLAAVAATLLASSSAYAADAIIYQDTTPYTPAAAAQFDWSGFYLGVDGGYVWTRASVPGLSESFNGGLLGAHAGYNMQHDDFVFGLEGNIAYTWNSRTEQISVAPPADLTVGTDWQGSIRARAGFALDRTFIYGTGGVAFTQAYAKVDAGTLGSVTESKTLTGWTLGAGVEHALTENWTVRGEYRYSDYGRVDLGLGGFDPKVTEHALRAGVSFKF